MRGLDFWTFCLHSLSFNNAPQLLTIFSGFIFKKSHYENLISPLLGKINEHTISFACKIS